MKENLQKVYGHARTKFTERTLIKKHHGLLRIVDHQARSVNRNGLSLNAIKTSYETRHENISQPAINNRTYMLNEATLKKETSEAELTDYDEDKAKELAKQTVCKDLLNATEKERRKLNRAEKKSEVNKENLERITAQKNTMVKYDYHGEPPLLKMLDFGVFVFIVMLLFMGLEAFITNSSIIHLGLFSNLAAIPASLILSLVMGLTLKAGSESFKEAPKRAFALWISGFSINVVMIAIRFSAGHDHVMLLAMLSIALWVGTALLDIRMNQNRNYFGICKKEKKCQREGQNLDDIIKKCVMRIESLDLEINARADRFVKDSYARRKKNARDAAYDFSSEKKGLEGLQKNIDANKKAGISQILDTYNLTMDQRNESDRRSQNGWGAFQSTVTIILALCLFSCSSENNYGPIETDVTVMYDNSGSGESGKFKVSSPEEISNYIFANYANKNEMLREQIIRVKITTIGSTGLREIKAVVIRIPEFLNRTEVEYQKNLLKLKNDLEDDLRKVFSSPRTDSRTLLFEALENNVRYVENHDSQKTFIIASDMLAFSHRGIDLFKYMDSNNRINIPKAMAEIDRIYSFPDDLSKYHFICTGRPSDQGDWSTSEAQKLFRDYFISKGAVVEIVPNLF